MNRSILCAAIVAVLLSGAALGYWFGATRTPHASITDTASSTDTGKRKVLYWHDPMVPNVKFDKPGKSPYMDMELVPVYADETDEGVAVRVSSTVAQNLGLRLGKVEKIPWQTRLNAVGSVAFDERLLDVVQARVEGYITHLYVKAPFATVHRGQPLAEILSPQWLAAQEEYVALLQARSERGQSIRDAARQRLTVLGVPEPTILALERDHKTRATTTVLAPSNGVVTELSVRKGAAFASGAPLFRLNGLETVWVNAQVPEAQVSMFPVGATVITHATAWPAVAFNGKVIALLPEVDAPTRTLTARLEIQNTDLKLAPGMFVSLEFTSAAHDPQLVVPSEAIIMTGERTVVVVAREGGGFDVVPITVGAESQGKTVVLAGLTAGQSVVRSGQFLIDSEASLRSAVERLSPEAGATEHQP